MKAVFKYINLEYDKADDLECEMELQHRAEERERLQREIATTNSDEDVEALNNQ